MPAAGRAAQHPRRVTLGVEWQRLRLLGVFRGHDVQGVRPSPLRFNVHTRSHPRRVTDGAWRVYARASLGDGDAGVHVRGRAGELYVENAGGGGTRSALGGSSVHLVREGGVQRLRCGGPAQGKATLDQLNQAAPQLQAAFYEYSLARVRPSVPSCGRASGSMLARWGILCALLTLGVVARGHAGAAIREEPALADARAASNVRGATVTSLAALAVKVGAIEADLLELSEDEMVELLTVDHRGLVGVLGRRKILKELAARADRSLLRATDPRGRDAASDEEISALRARLDLAEATMQRRQATASEEVSALRARVDDVVKASNERRRLQAGGGGDDDTCLSSDEIAYSAMRSSQAMSAAFGDFHDRVLPTLMADSTGGENLACRCAICADTPVNGSLCLPWMSPELCDCLGAQAKEPAPGRAFTSATGCLGTPDQGFNDPTTTQLFPVSELKASGRPPCCRKEWPHNVTVEQVSTADSEVFSQDDIEMKICGVLTFKWHGFENVEQVSDTWDPYDGRQPVSQSGVGAPSLFQFIRSGDPSTGGEFHWTFSQPGKYYFRSYFTNSIRVKVTVMDCSYCTVTAGYDGEQPRSAMIALSSQTPGDYHLRVADHASLGHVTVYANQTLTTTATGAPIGQLTLLDASIHVMSDASLVLDHVHVSSWVAVDRGGTLDNRGSLIEMDALPVPRAVEPYPECLPRMVGSLIYDYSETGNSAMLQCGQSGQWSSVVDTIHDGRNFEAWLIATKENVLHPPGTSTSFWNGGPGQGSNGYFGRPGTYGLLLRQEITEDVLRLVQNNIKTYFDEPSGQITQSESIVWMRYILGGGQTYTIRGEDETRRNFPDGRIPWVLSPYLGARSNPYINEVFTSSEQGFKYSFNMINGGRLSLAHIKFSQGSSYSGQSQGCTRSCSASVNAGAIRAKGSAVIELEDCEFTGFSAYYNNGAGARTWQGPAGAIYMDNVYEGGSSQLTVVDSLFQSNQGQQSSAIYVGEYRTSVHISNTEFQSNTPCQCTSGGNCCNSQSPPWNDASLRSSMAVYVPRGSSTEGYRNPCSNMHGMSTSAQEWHTSGTNPSRYCALKNGD